MSNQQDDDDKVGYKKPPKSTRFKPGLSGNPKGRPKKNKNFEQEVKDIFGTKIQVTRNGKKAWVTKRYALLEQLVNGAIGKNTTLMRMAIPLLRIADNVPELEVLPEDKKALEKLLRNINNTESQP
jgi:hypothetical protein